MADALRVTARLSSPLAGDAPQLDGLMELVLSRHHPKGEPGYKVDRRYACPEQGAIPIPLVREWVGPWLVARCSSPILPVPVSDQHEYVCKRIETAEAPLLDPAARRTINTTNSWTKAYRLPLRTRRVDRVVWLAVGERREVLQVCKRVPAVGKKVADGYGRVDRWEVDRVEADCSWFAPSPRGPVLMRPLPASMKLPPGLLGARPDYGACAPPYWHPDRAGEVIVPC